MTAPRSRSVARSWASTSLLLVGGLAANTASAAWYCGVLDGPNSPGAGVHFASPNPAAAGPFYGATTETVGWPSRMTALVSGGGNVFQFYGLRTPDDSAYSIKYGIGFTPYDSPQWVLENMATSSTPIGKPAPVFWNGSLWVAYETGPTSSSTPSSLALNPPSSFLGLPLSPPRPIPIPSPYPAWTTSIHGATLVVFQNRLWAFYTSCPNMWSSPPSTWMEQARYSVYDGSGFTATNVPLDGIAVSGAPAPIVYQGSLVVFYLDETQHTLVVKSSSDGVNFTKSTIASTAHYNSMNGHLAPGIDTNGILHVFYGAPDGSLAEASASSPGGPFTVRTVDAAYLWPEPAAAAWSGTQVYYIDNVYDRLKGAWFDGASWHPAVIDGYGGSLCASQGGGATSDAITGPIAVAVPSTGPQVFYADLSTGDLRFASWY